MDEFGALERLVRRYSPSGRESRAVAEFVRIARALGYRSRIDAAGNGVASRGRGRPLLLFLGHIDTVEGVLPVRRTGSRLYGRGTVDAKAALVSALFAGQDLGRALGEYRVVAAVGEETDSRGARHVLRGARPDRLIVGEPSGWQGVTLGYKGELRLEALFRGDRTHYASPEPTTLDRCLTWVGRVRDLVARHGADSPFRTLTVKVVGLAGESRGGEEEARVILDFRIPPGLSTREVLQALPRDPPRPRVQIHIRVEPAEVDRRNRVVEALLAGIRRNGGRPTLWRKTGTSDLNLAVRAWAVPAAVYGPGNARLDHTDREFVARADLHRSVRVLEAALRDLRDEPPTLRGSAACA